MKQEASKQPKKRISFLMPYIDFCFMLIIIFVGMLSIAYFEPLGKTDLETKPTPIINQTAGIHEVNPNGVQVTKTGVGEEQKINVPHPLIGQTGGVMKPAAGTRTGLQPLAQSAQAGPKPTVLGSKTATGKGDTPKEYVNPDELKKLQDQIDKQKAEIEKLKETQKEGTGGTQPPATGKGDNYYIDLRPK
jgi:hypothetical protein